MAAPSKRCNGRTKSGLRCKNAAKEEFGAAVTFVTTHWDAIRTALSTMGWAFVTPYEWSSETPVSDERIRGLAADAKRISAKSSRILSEGIDSATESSRLKHEFAMWFKSLPEDVREKTLIHVGQRTLNQLLE